MGRPTLQVANTTRGDEIINLSRRVSFGASLRLEKNLPEIANILTGMRHVGIYHLLYSEVLGSFYLLA